MQNIPCVILCGGKSSRMQRDKCFLEFGGKSLVRYQFEKMSEFFNRVFLSCKADKFGGEFNSLIFDEREFGEIHSPMLAMYSILKYFDDEFVFVIAVDMPFVKFQSIERLILQSKNTLIVAAQSAGKQHLLCGLYHSSLAPLCAEFLRKDIHKMRALSQSVPHKITKFADDKEWTNLNSPQDYESVKNA